MSHPNNSTNSSGFPPHYAPQAQIPNGGGLPPYMQPYGYPPYQMPPLGPPMYPPYHGMPMPAYHQPIPHNVAAATTIQHANVDSAKKVAPTTASVTNQGGIAGKTAADWAEYKDPKSGRKYYYNKVTKTTQWSKPQELIDEEQKTSSPEKKEQNAGSIPPEKKDEIQKAASPEKQVVAPQKLTIEPDPIVQASNKKNIYANKEEAKMVFKKLLEDSGVQTTWDWYTAMKKIISDERYKAIKTMHEKKSLFQEFIEERKRQEREEKRKKLKELKTDFVKMLSEISSIAPHSKYRSIVPIIENDPRYVAVENEEDRIDFFEDYIIDLERRLKKEQEEKTKAAMDNFKHLLERKYDEGVISYKSIWRKAREKLTNEQEFQVLDEVNRLIIWDTFMKDLKKHEEEKKSKDKEKRKKLERKNRTAFWNIMSEMHKEGKISVLTRWKEFKALAKETEAYKNVSNQSGPTPKQLYYEFIDDLELRYKEDKRRLKSIMNDNNFTIVPGETQFEQFFQVVSKDERFQTVDQQNAKVFFGEALEKTKEKDKEKERKKQKIINKFKDLLDGTSQITTSSTYQEIKPLLEDKSAFIHIESESEREKIFNEYIEKLKRKEEKKKRKRMESSGGTTDDEQEDSPESETAESAAKKQKIESSPPSQIPATEVGGDAESNEEVDTKNVSQTPTDQQQQQQEEKEQNEKQSNPNESSMQE